MERLTPFLLPSLSVIIIVFTTFFLYPWNPFSNITYQTDIFTTQYEDGNCDLFKGKWIRDPKGSSYSNSTCRTIPDSKNCIQHGRPDTEFVFWRWKPHGCDLPRFNPKLFLRMFRGKKMHFVGDSLARNQMESLLCLLSMEETPRDIYNDADDRNRIWYFPEHDFMLSVSWTQYLVASREKKDANHPYGVVDIDINEMDGSWSRALPNTDILVVSAIHWFYRPIFVYRGDQILGCLSCNSTSTPKMNHLDVFKLVYSNLLWYVDVCEKCKEDMVTVLRTYSPHHFENGSYSTGGFCTKTSPFTEDQLNPRAGDMGIRTLQLEQLNQIRHRSRSTRKFVALDITKATMMRPDGHPNGYWGKKGTTGYNDCVHWCMPGPIDAWNDLLIATLRRLR